MYASLACRRGLRWRRQIDPPPPPPLRPHVGHPDLVATTPQEYVRRAVALAEDIARLQELRAGLRGRMACSLITDGERLTRSLETAYRKMWARYCNGEQHQTGSIEVGEENGVGHA